MSKAQKNAADVAAAALGADLLQPQQDAAAAAAAAGQQQGQGAAAQTDRTREVAKLFRVHQTVCEMLIDRGYQLNDDPENAWLTGGNLQAFKAKVLPAGSSNEQPLLRGALTMVASKPDNTKNNGERRSIMIWYDAGSEPEKGKAGERQIRAENMRKIHDKAEDFQVHDVIVIHSCKLQALARTYVETANRAGGKAYIELFPEDHLVVNITKHELVPKHEPLTPDQTKEVLQAFALNISMLPRILATDPVALYFGLRRGQVVRITRKSETAGQYVTFRQVV